MTNEEIKRFAITLAKCEDEEQVINLLKQYGFWDDSSCWRNFGDIENNYSTIGNQQASSDSALVEKIINSIDAVIMGDLLSKNIDPSGDLAPKTITEYLKKYKEIPEGKLSLLDSTTRGELSKDILLVSTKNPSTRHPNYCLIDSGEGQTPLSMPNTILSISASNKMRVGAVQGKFNMGGTGVLVFSGEHKFEIVISRKRQDIPKELRQDETFDKWSVTIVRKESPKGNMKSSCFKYLAPKGNLLMFEADSMKLKPKYNTAEAIPYAEDMYWGTFIKIFDYNIKGANSVSTINLHDRLSLLIPEIALPIKIIETRKTESTSARTLYGLIARLEEDKKDALDIKPIGISGKICGETIKATVFLFNKDRGESYKKKEGIVYAMNGQCQGVESSTFFKNLNLSYIADSLLIVVDCSQLSSKTIEDLFLNSRDRLKKGKVREDLIAFLTDSIKDMKELKALNNKRRNEQLEDKIGESKIRNNVVENVISKSKILNNLLLEGKDINSPVNGKKTADIPNTIETKQFPTYFKLRKNNRASAEINRKIRISLDTDAENDYFTRVNMSGTYTLQANNNTITDCSIHIFNGIATLNINITEDIFTIGEVYNFHLAISDDSRYEPINVDFELKILPKTSNTSPPTSGPRGIITKKEKGMPFIKEIRKDEWSKFDFDATSAVKVIKKDETYDFICNLDNKYLLAEILASKEDSKVLESIFTTSIIVSAMSIIAHYSKLNKEIEKSSDEDKFDIEKIVYESTKALAPTVVPTIKELGDLSKFQKH